MKRAIFIAILSLLLVASVFADDVAKRNAERDVALAKRTKDVAVTGAQRDVALATRVKDVAVTGAERDVALGKRLKDVANKGAALEMRVSALENKGGSSGAVIQAQQTGNRSAAWAVRLSFVYKDGNGVWKYPDIEEVERVLSPIERGDMSPKAFEKAVWDAAKAEGWTYIEGPFDLLVVQQTTVVVDEDAIANKAAAKLQPDVQATKDAATRAESSATNAATSASNAAQSAADAALSAKTAAEHMGKATVSATATAYVGVDTYNADRSMDDTRFKRLEAFDDCIETKVDEIGTEVKTNTEVIGYILTSAGFHLAGKDMEADASIYLAILKDYEGSHLAAAARLKQLLWSDKKVAKARVYAADALYKDVILVECGNDHGKAQMNLRSWGLSEEEIREVCKNNKAQYVTIK